MVPPTPGLLAFHQRAQDPSESRQSFNQQGKLCLTPSIIFSVQGSRSLAHLMATGDFDGWVAVRWPMQVYASGAAWLCLHSMQLQPSHVHCITTPSCACVLICPSHVLKYRDPTKDMPHFGSYAVNNNALGKRDAGTMSTLMSTLMWHMAQLILVQL